MLTGVRCSARYQAEDEHDKCGFSSLNLSQMILSLFFGKISFVLPSCKKKKKMSGYYDGLFGHKNIFRILYL